MKNTLNKLLWNEKGQALPIALAMLAIGSLVITPLLNLTETALRSGISEEGRMYEHYAANAGTSDGLLKIVTDNPNIPPVGENWSYSIADTNGRTVEVIISTIDQSNMKITSTATSNNGESTEINCYVEKMTYLPNAITSTHVVINKDGVVNGNVQYDSSLGTITNGGTINGEIIDAPVSWPTTEEVDAFYLDQVDGAPTIEGNLTLNLGSETLLDPYSLGPIFINGNLSITRGPAAVRLDGTVYVNGTVSINRDVNVYMNNNTIFSKSSLWISGDAKVYESGCIVSIPQITFYPDVDPDGCAIIWSVGSQIDVGSAGKTVYGAAYSPTQITIANSSILTYKEFPPEMSIPPLPGKSFKIVGWESTSQ